MSHNFPDFTESHKAVIDITATTRTERENWDWIITSKAAPGVNFFVYFEEDMEEEVENLAEWIREELSTRNGKPWEFVVMRDGKDVTSAFQL